MSTPGYFEIYPAARPPLPAGLYAASSHSDLEATPPHSTQVAIPVDDTQFFVHLVSPRYVMPPEEILSTFPPATSAGDWRERLPQIVLKRRTLPWERNPDPSADPATAPPWLALVVLADGEAQLSQPVDVAQCVTPGVDLGDDADAAQGVYLEVRQSVVHAVFPCRDELDLLCHVRKVDLSDTELALGDDDGYLAVVLSSRLPQPGLPAKQGDDWVPVKYTACLVNLEHQLDTLLPTEPTPAPSFDRTQVLSYVETALQPPAPEATVDQIAMGLGPAQEMSQPVSFEATARAERVERPETGTSLAPYATARGLEVAASSWATGPTAKGVQRSSDLEVAVSIKSGDAYRNVTLLDPTYRYPVLVSWEFTCTATGGFERLMNALTVGLLGTLDPDQPAPLPEVAPTGHVGLDHVSRRGEPDRAWYRGPFSPQPTQRVMPTDGVLPLAHVGDQLRTVVPDGREDLSRAALFEIGRLLTLSKPTLVAALMAWRSELFGAARARELADLLAGSVVATVGVQAVGGRASLEGLIRTHVVDALAQAPQLAPRALDVTAPRVPEELAQLQAAAVLTGLGADPKQTLLATRTYGAEGLGGVGVPVTQVPTVAVSQDQRAMASLQRALVDRVQQLTVDALKLDPAGQRPPSRRRDTLDRLVAAAAARREA
ncbi:MAG TPA: hypothetical protein VMI11_13930 [Actinomycetes bacterium]|nr:hypothetical protein [Actinomycetes bacterium]